MGETLSRERKEKGKKEKADVKFENGFRKEIMMTHAVASRPIERTNLFLIYRLPSSFFPVFFLLFFESSSIIEKIKANRRTKFITKFGNNGAIKFQSVNDSLKGG